jgi:hypothetical protein
MTDREFRAARKQVKKKKGFFIHLAVFLSTALFFFLMNVATSPGDWWWFFPMLPWGIGLAIHYLVVFGFPGSGVLSREWEEKEMQKELRQRGLAQSYQQELPAPGEEDLLDLDQPQKVRQKQWDEDEIV